MKQIILFFLIMITNQIQGQPKEYDEYLIVNATSLAIRETPTLKAKKIISAKKGEWVKVVDRRLEDKYLEVVDGIKDTWAKIKYKDVVGYMFAGYLSQTSILKPNENWKGNYVLLIEQSGEGCIFYDNLNWYGVYSREDGEYIEKVNVSFNFVQSAYDYDGIHCEISTNRADKSGYLIGTNKPIKLGRIGISIGAFVNQKILNRQCLPIPYYNQEGIMKTNLCLSASANNEELNSCYQEGYQLSLIDSNRSDVKVAFLEGLVKKRGSCNIPYLTWFGDINGDFIPDFLFNQSTTQEIIHTLCVSKQLNNKVTYELEAQYLE